MNEQASVVTGTGKAVTRGAVVVVGGGLTGLAAAVDAARRGRRVVLLERGDTLGGRGRSEGCEGYGFNLGPHALYPRARALLERLGVEPAGRAPRVAGLTMRIGERVHPLPAGALGLMASGALGVRSKWTLARLLAELTMGDPSRLDAVPLAGWLAAAPPDARAVIEALVRVSTYCHAPDRISAGLAARQLRAARVWYLDGGWQRLVDALAARAREAGVEIRLGARADALEVGAGALEAVRVAGEGIPCSDVILTLSPKASVALLGERASAELRRFASRAHAVRAACLDVALRTLPRSHPTLLLGVDRPTYLSVHSSTARVAPDGGALIHVARYLAPDERVEPALVRAELEASLDFAQPGWRDACVRARWSPALTVMHALPEQALGGLAGRPGVDASGLGGVWLAGDWVGPEGLLLDAGLESARAAVGRLSSASVRAA